MMNRYLCYMVLFILFSLAVIHSPLAQQQIVRTDFSGGSASANNVTIMGAGFDSLPKADVLFGSIPTNNAFDDATDGKGVIVVAEPGEGVMIFASTMNTPNAALIRCNVMTNAPHASVIIAAVGSSEETWISQSGPANGAVFVNEYKRVSTLFAPSTNGFQSLIQIVNTSETEPLTAYVDNLDIILISQDLYYSGAFLDGDSEDPEIISMTSSPAFPPTPTLTPTPTPSAIPTPQTENELTITLPDGVPLEMVLIPAGSFMMGSNYYGVGDETPVHQVTISQAYYMGKYEVTQAQWQAVMGNNPSYFEGGSLPIEYVSWNDCQEFIEKLNVLGQGTFRLPSEAEWEYACRAGSTTEYYWGDSDAQMGDYAWYTDNSGGTTHPVGQKRPNAWGLYDMSGNVWEWCQDLYENDYTSGSIRVVRGGSWGNAPVNLRSAERGYWSPSRGFNFQGFRIVALPNASPPSSIPTHTPTPSATPTPIAQTDNELPIILPGGVLLEMVSIPAGSFMMGSSDGINDGEKPVHQVTISQSFYMGKYEVTQAQWQAVMGNNPSRFQGANNPVEQISWNDCQEFIRKLNALGHGTFRLPTEAEWEYACRAGTTTKYYWGDSDALMGDNAWYGDNSNFSTHPVGQKRPNAWGLYDMSGNVWEWCQDWYGSDYYSDNRANNNPQGPDSGSYRVRRGGSWNYSPVYLRSAYRNDRTPDYTIHNLGFRIVALPNASPPSSIPTHTPTPSATPTPIAQTENELPIILPGGVLLEMVSIPAGSFMMGSSDGINDGEKPVHQVTISQSFYMGKYEVTQAQWQTMMENNRSRFQGTNNPVEQISWNHCQEFIHRLNALGQGTFRLPTEAEWEYVCRAGTTTEYYWGDSADQIGNYAWYSGNSISSTHPVGQKRPNAWGLYDMSGNVWEWCQDWYDKEYYANSPSTDPVNSVTNQFRVVRGGSWNSIVRYSRSADRYWKNPGSASYRYGLRVVRTP